MIPTSLEVIEAAAMQLPQADRVHLAERLLISLDDENGMLAEWVAQAERRADAYDRGEISVIGLDDVMAQARAGLVGNTGA